MSCMKVQMCPKSKVYLALRSIHNIGKMSKQISRLFTMRVNNYEYKRRESGAFFGSQVQKPRPICTSETFIMRLELTSNFTKKI